MQINMNKITFKSALPFLVLIAIATAAVFIPTLPNFDNGKYNTSDMAWMLTATALVFLMTPGLAFFYGGMVHRKNVLSTMIKSVLSAGIVSILWIVVGFSLSFGKSIHGIIGDPTTFLFFRHVTSGSPTLPGATSPLTIPLLLFS